jgi:hypothetical protein
MPFLARTQQALRTAISEGQDVWCGSEVVSVEEHRRFVAEGACLTRLTYSLAQLTPELLERTVGTMYEHHPGESVVVEGDGVYDQEPSNDA